MHAIMKVFNLISALFIGTNLANITYIANLLSTDERFNVHPSRNNKEIVAGTYMDHGTSDNIAMILPLMMPSINIDPSS